MYNFTNTPLYIDIDQIVETATHLNIPLGTGWHRICKLNLYREHVKIVLNHLNENCLDYDWVFMEAMESETRTYHKSIYARRRK